MRVGEVATFIRHVMRETLSQPTLDGRLSSVGVPRRHFEKRDRDRTAHGKADLYRVAVEVMDTTEATP